MFALEHKGVQKDTKSVTYHVIIRYFLSFKLNYILKQTLFVMKTFNYIILGIITT